MNILFIIKVKIWLIEWSYKTPPPPQRLTIEIRTIFISWAHIPKIEAPNLFQG